MFIGEREVVSTEPDAEREGYLTIVLDDESTTSLHEGLYNEIVIEEKGNGSITDNVNNHFAVKFVTELSTYDLGFYFAGNIGVAMNTLAHNLREELLRKTFKCTGANDIPLDLLVTSAVEEEE